MHGSFSLSGITRRAARPGVGRLDGMSVKMDQSPAPAGGKRRTPPTINTFVERARDPSFRRLLYKGRCRAKKRLFIITFFPRLSYALNGGTLAG